MLLFLILFFEAITLTQNQNIYYLVTYDREYANPADIRATINPNPVTYNLTGFVIAPMVTTVSTDSNIEINVLKLLYTFLIYGFYLRSK